MIGRKIGWGSFGEVYLGQDLMSRDLVAIKLESTKTKFPQLMYETKLYKILFGGVGIPNVKWKGCEEDFNIMVMELLGPSLEDLFQVCGKKLSLKTTLMIATQLITRLEFIHNKNFLHRDIKPENFLIGLGKMANLVYVIDFGLSKKYRNAQTLEHIQCIEGKSMIGTARYASLNAHLGLEQGRKDDLEGLGYTLIYLIQGKLPWQGISSNSKKEKYEKIQQMKIDTSFAALCRGIPNEFQHYMEYCRSLRFSEKPDYLYLKNLFRNLYLTSRFACDFIYD